MEVHCEKYSYDSIKQLVSGEDLRNPLFYRTIISGNSWYGQNFECNTDFQERYKYYCYVYAKKYLDVNKFQEFTNNFAWVDKNIENGGQNNLSFAKYAEKKLQVIPKY